MTLPFTIRKARTDDVFEVHQVHTTAIRDGAGDHYPPDVVEVWVGAFNPDNFPGNLERMEFYVAELPDRRIAAFLAFDLDTAEVDSVYVAPWGKGLGLGSFLMGFVDGIARRAGLDSLWLDSSINAVAFYEKHDWKEVERHTRVRNGVEIAVVRMEKTLGT